jgi:chaperonin GroES
MELDVQLKLEDLVGAPNIAEMLDDESLRKIGYDVYQGFETDLNSRSAWEKKTEESMKLALQVVEAKSFPWPNSSNVKFPLLTIAALQYHARSYPVLVDGSGPVKCRVIGDDPQGTKEKRAERVENHMSFQILEQDEAWESEMDKVLITQPIIGCAFKKTYFDPIKKFPISENILARDLVVNYWTKSLDTAPRVTQILYYSKNDVYERVARGLWLEMTEPAPNSIMSTGLGLVKDKSQGVLAPESVDSSTPYEILEQHTYLDLDGDGYAEPYVVYVRRDTKQVLRIVARYFSSSIERNDKGIVLKITPETYFTKFPFIPSPDGGFYDLGFGVLLGPLNQSIDTIINQLIDCGTMANTAGGFLSRGIKLRGGNYNFAPLEWKHVDSTGDDLRKGIMPLPVREPSQVLFTLLNLLINYGERVGGSVDILVGQNPGQNTAATTVNTMAEQGMKIFSGIFKRTYRSLKDEFKKLYRLNQLYTDEVVKFGDGEIVTFEDYQGSSYDIRPAADPNIVSDTQRVQQAQALMQMATSTPGFNMYEVQKNMLKALKVANIEQILPDPKGPNAIKPQPNPKVQIEQMKNQTKQADIQARTQTTMAKMQLDAAKIDAQIKKLEAEALKALAEADGVDTGHAIAMINAELSAQKQHRNSLMDAIELMHDIEMDYRKSDSGKGEEQQPM